MRKPYIKSEPKVRRNPCVMSEPQVARKPHL